MIRLRLKLTLLYALILSTSGCSLVESPRSAMRRMTRMYSPNPDDWADGSEEESTEWDFVGDEGRADTKREKDPDQWYKKYLMSEKANSIERNLGYD